MAENPTPMVDLREDADIPEGWVTISVLQGSGPYCAVIKRSLMLSASGWARAKFSPNVNSYLTAEEDAVDLRMAINYLKQGIIMHHDLRPPTKMESARLYIAARLLEIPILADLAFRALMADPDPWLEVPDEEIAAYQAGVKMAKVFRYAYAWGHRFPHLKIGCLHYVKDQGAIRSKLHQVLFEELLKRGNELPGFRKDVPWFGERDREWPGIQIVPFNRVNYRDTDE